MQGSKAFETDEIWEYKGSWAKKGKLTKPRGGLGAVYHNRKVLVVGGDGKMGVYFLYFNCLLSLSIVSLLEFCSQFRITKS